MQKLNILEDLPDLLFYPLASLSCLMQQTHTLLGSSLSFTFVRNMCSQLSRTPRPSTWFAYVPAGGLSGTPHLLPLLHRCLFLPTVRLVFVSRIKAL